MVAQISQSTLQGSTLFFSSSISSKTQLKRLSAYYGRDFYKVIFSLGVKNLYQQGPQYYGPELYVTAELPITPCVTMMLSDCTKSIFFPHTEYRVQSTVHE